MVYCGTGPSYPTSIDAANNHDTERGFGDCNEAGGFTGWRKCYQHEPNLGTTSEPDALITGYQESER